MCAPRIAPSTDPRARSRSGCTDHPTTTPPLRRSWCSCTAADGRSATSTPTTGKRATTRSVRVRWWCRWTTGWHPSTPIRRRSKMLGPQRNGRLPTPRNWAPTPTALPSQEIRRAAIWRRWWRSWHETRAGRRSDSSCCGTPQRRGTHRCRRSQRTPTPRCSTTRRSRDLPVGIWAIWISRLCPRRWHPARADDLTGLAPAYIAVAGHDPLRDDGARYAELLAAAGVPAELHNAETLIHGYLGYAGVVPAATDATDRGLSALRKALHAS